MRVRIPWKRGPGRGPGAVVSSTYTEFERFRDMPGAAIAALRFRHAFPSTAGAIGISLVMQPFARRSWSVSAWETEADLQAFLRSPAHLAIVRRYRSTVRVSGKTWTVDQFRLRDAWRCANMHQRT